MLLDKFEAHLRAHKSETARVKYVQAARAFLVYLDITHQTLPTMKGGTLRDFVTWMIAPEPGMKVPSAATVHLMVAGVKSYLDFLTGEDVPVPKQAKPERPRLPQHFPLVMSREQLNSYVQCCLQEPDPLATALLIMPYCGLRVSEVCQLRLRDVLWTDVAEGDRRYVLHVEKGKGGKERLTPMFTGPAGLASSALTLYLAEERPKYRLDREFPREDRWLFPMPVAHTLRPITPRMLQKRVIKFRRIVGIQTLHPHACRSHWATALLSIPLDVIEVARYMGHTRNIDTLANHYAGVRMDDVEAFMGVIAKPTQNQIQATRRQGVKRTLTEIRAAVADVDADT